METDMTTIMETNPNLSNTAFSSPITPTKETPSNLLPKLGMRVQDCKSGDRGVVMYTGNVDGTDGLWIGVDWDDTGRGKHNGSHKGKTYFIARSASSGSFVRASKLLTGMDLEAAVRDKYQSAPPDTTPVENLLQHAINARFVQFVGMEKVSKKQSELETLRLVELKDCFVSHAGQTPLGNLLPRVTQLNLSGCLLPDWQSVAEIVCQLPKLRMLNLSDNRLAPPHDSSSLIPSLGHVTHLVLNSMQPRHSWADLLTCAAMFPKLHTLQVAYNTLKTLGAVPAGVLECVEILDVGANPLSDWTELLHLGRLPRLQELNVNNCELPCVEFPDTPVDDGCLYFPHLESLYIANNPLDNWRSVCQLSKLPSLRNLALGFLVRPDDYFPEFTYAIIRSLTMLNRTLVSRKEKRDYELFYLKTFSGDYYEAGGAEDPDEATLSQEFVERHPTYLQLVREIGAPYDERRSLQQRQSKARLKDQKLAVQVTCQDGRTLDQVLLPSLKVSRLKMMLKRNLKLPNSAKLTLTYTPSEKREQVIPLDSDHRDLAYYSLGAGDELHVSWL